MWQQMLVFSAQLASSAYIAATHAESDMLAMLHRKGSYCHLMPRCQILPYYSVCVSLKGRCLLLSARSLLTACGAVRSIMLCMENDAGVGGQRCSNQMTVLHFARSSDHHYRLTLIVCDQHSTRHHTDQNFAVTFTCCNAMWAAWVAATSSVDK